MTAFSSHFYIFPVDSILVVLISRPPAGNLIPIGGLFSFVDDSW